MAGEGDDDEGKRAGGALSAAIRRGGGRSELSKRALVFAALILGLALPMWHSPAYCKAVLWFGLASGAAEWWVAARNAPCAALQDLPWLIVSFCSWVAPTSVMLMQYSTVVGHRRIVECIIIQLAFGDTAQLLCGRLFGRTHICGRLSPKKTLEGYIGGLLLTCAYGCAVHGWSAVDVILVFVAGCCGDLFFSSVKRRLGLKDFSRVLSSHGGILDRIDSYVFAINALFWRNILLAPDVASAGGSVS